MYKALRIHFVGIGGIGMSGIAEVLLNLGYPVSGSDIKTSPSVERLENLGARVFIGHKAENIRGVDVVVYSSAVNKSNEEVAAALLQKIPVIRRAEMLAELMRLSKYGIAVAGTHGKTTTTSLLASVLHEGGLDPTAVIGGKLNSLGSNAKLGRGDFMLVEADESDGSFLHLSPSIAIVTNIDPDHLENFGTFDRYREAFSKFCEKIPFYGLIVLCAEHPETRELARRLDKRVQTYGFSADHDWNARNIKSEGLATSYDLYRHGDFVTTITLNLAGRHNVLNSLATIAVAMEVGVSLERAKTALSRFKGVGRRLEILHRSDDFAVVDDYAHHPVEIRATLAAAHDAFTGRCVVLFQPHRYTRLENLFADFSRAFDLADEVFISKLYSAGESPIAGVDSQALVKAIAAFKDAPKVHYVDGDEQAIAEHMVKTLKAGDVLFTLGAGDITKISRRIASELDKKTAQKTAS